MVSIENEHKQKAKKNKGLKRKSDPSNDEKVIEKESKDISLPNRRIQCLGISMHGDEFDDTNYQLLDISNDHVQES